MPQLDILPKLVDGFATNIVAYATLLAAVATISMALLELVKAVLGLRPLYHRRMVRQWLHTPDRYEELLILTVSDVSSARALFDQPTEKMMGQIQAATAVVVEFPALFPAMYDFLTRAPRSQAAAAETDSSGRLTAASPPADADVWQAYVSSLEPGGTESARSPDPDGAVAAARTATHARARIDHFISRKLDAFQTRAQYVWARLNQTAAIVGAGAIILYILRSQEAVGFVTTGLQQFTLAAFGGMLAPFAKDVVSALTGLKTRP